MGVAADIPELRESTERKKKKWDGGSFKDVMKEDERLETHIKRNRQWEIESPSEGR